MRRPLTTFLIAAFLLLATGCERGPAGPVGPRGSNGNANVFSTNFTFSMQDATINGTVASVQYDVPGITASVVDEGAVLLFFREQGTWTAMPYTYGVESTTVEAVDYTVALGYGYDDAFLEVFYETSIDDPSVLNSQPDRDIKAVIIDGFPLGKGNVDWTNYEAVKAYFNLED